MRFLAERYLVVSAERSLDDLRKGESGDGGAHLVEALYLPAEEVCLYLFEGESEDEVARAGTFDRVARVVPVLEAPE